jgi:lipopolysaccharide O-acetyltransferase
MTRGIRLYLKENGPYLTLQWVGSKIAGQLRRLLIGATFSVESETFIRGLSSIQVGQNFRMGKGLWLQAVTAHERPARHRMRIVIGNNVSISLWGHIAAADSIEIGDDVLIGSRVVVIDHDHGSYGAGLHSSPDMPPRLRPLRASPIRIGSNVWIGDGVSVLSGANIGDGCVIGANAVVVGEIPPFTVAVGVPARPIKRFDFAAQRWIECRD